MPIFEYNCNACGEDFEKLVFASTKVACPKCGAEDVKKKLSVCGFSGLANIMADGGSSSSRSGCGSCSKTSCGSCK